MIGNKFGTYVLKTFITHLLTDILNHKVSPLPKNVIIMLKMVKFYILTPNKFVKNIVRNKEKSKKAENDILTEEM